MAEAGDRESGAEGTAHPGDGTAASSEPGAGGPGEGDRDGSGEPARDIVDMEATNLDYDPAGSRGPGIHPTGREDVTAYLALFFAVLGWVPERHVDAALDPVTGGPFVFPAPIPAVFAMLGVFAGVVAVLRGMERGDRWTRGAGLVAVAAGLVRLFLVPFF